MVGPNLAAEGILVPGPWLILRDDETFWGAAFGSELVFGVLYVIGVFWLVEDVRVWGLEETDGMMGELLRGMGAPSLRLDFESRGIEDDLWG